MTSLNNGSEDETYPRKEMLECLDKAVLSFHRFMYTEEYFNKIHPHETYHSKCSGDKS